MQIWLYFFVSALNELIVYKNHETNFGLYDDCTFYESSKSMNYCIERSTVSTNIASKGSCVPLSCYRTRDLLTLPANVSHIDCENNTRTQTRDFVLLLAIIFIIIVGNLKKINRKNEKIKARSKSTQTVLYLSIFDTGSNWV